MKGQIVIKTPVHFRTFSRLPIKISYCFFFILKMVMIKGQHEGMDEALFYIDIFLCNDSD